MTKILTIVILFIALLACSCETGLIRIEKIIDTNEHFDGFSTRDIIAICHGVTTEAECLDRAYEPVKSACMEYAVKNKLHVAEMVEGLEILEISYDTWARDYTVRLMCGWYTSNKETK